MLGMGDEYYKEEDIEDAWFSHEVGGYLCVDYDDAWGYVDNPGADLEVPDTRSNYADTPEDLISVAEHLIEMEVRDLDSASVSDVFSDLNGSTIVGFINGTGIMISGLVSFVVKFVIYGLSGLILLNIINEFTGWFDDSSADDFGSLFMASALGLWGSVSLFRWALIQWRESRDI